MDHINKPTLTIGITAFNEAKNIQNILRQILKLTDVNYMLDQILLISDGSTDITVSRAQEITSTHIKIIDDSNRMGKPARLNQMFDMVQSDILVIIDADLTLRSVELVDVLIQPLLLKQNVLLSAGISETLAPHNFIQKIAKRGVDIWMDVIHSTSKSELYLCGGQIRAFGKALYKHIIFPDFSADDSYSYLSCKKLGYEFAYVSAAKTYYKLPSSFSDYVSQTLRYTRSEGIQMMNFDKKFVQKYFVIGLNNKVQVLSRYLVSDFFLTATYLLCYFSIRCLGAILPEKDRSKWTILTTTK